MLYDQVVQVDERVVLHQDKCEIARTDVPVVTGISGDQIEIWKKIDRTKVYDDLKCVYDKGIRRYGMVGLLKNLSHNFLLAWQLRYFTRTLSRITS